MTKAGAQNFSGTQICNNSTTVPCARRQQNLLHLMQQKQQKHSDVIATADGEHQRGFWQAAEPAACAAGASGGALSAGTQHFLLHLRGGGAVHLGVEACSHGPARSHDLFRLVPSMAVLQRGARHLLEPLSLGGSVAHFGGRMQKRK
ncbi:hypothetical protein ON010_g4153 [Phytophthora cinnamomi]|nr:hypothetical protein ON010_g4153 [Phytophthora cinnamomi]